jgi:biopolymer transport protein ExbD|tara:strand:+ start:218 stop:646 length:429 start_codon:yes stop_codon:yes gene_type:complete
MGMSVGEKSGGLNSEINITPLADVMLVLLIIVMLIAPLLQAGVLVRLPEAANTNERTDNDNDTTVHVDSVGQYYVDNILTQERQLLTVIQTALDRKFERLVLIKADGGAPYSAIMNVFDQLQRAGIENIGLIAEQPGASGAF